MSRPPEKPKEDEVSPPQPAEATHAPDGDWPAPQPFPLSPVALVLGMSLTQRLIVEKQRNEDRERRVRIEERREAGAKVRFADGEPKIPSHSR